MLSNLLQQAQAKQQQQMQRDFSPFMAMAAERNAPSLA